VRRLLVAVVVVVGVVVLSAPAAGARLRTRATIFHAFDATGAPTIPVKSKSGHCFSGSLTINRSDAWRCLSGNFLYDPCFSSALHPGVVVCPNRVVKGGVEIHLKRKLPRKFADSGRPSLKHQPWDIQLASGRHCAFESGASNTVHGIRLNYFCGPRTKNGLWGYPRRRVEPWTIRIAPFNAKVLRMRAAIRHVWM
jgi:hypothetical protein